MKRHADPRHLHRIKLMQKLFSWNFQQKLPCPDDLKKIKTNLKKIDKVIQDCAPDRPLAQINKIDLSILRLSVFELIIEKSIPPKVVIDEAVELGKEFGSDSSPAFINGALGQAIKLKKIKI